MLKESILKMLKLDSLINNITGYIETKLDIVKLEVKEEVSKGIAKAAAYGLIGLLVTLVVLLFSFALAYKIGERVGVAGGFAIIGGFYLILGVILWLYRETIITRVENLLNKKTKK